MLELKQLKETLKRFNVLYIENTSEFRAEISNKLDGLFELIYVAKGTQEGLALFKKNNSKIVIVDVELISFDWLSLAKRMKSIREETKIIILSKHDGQKYLYDAIDIGITKFIRKPVAIEDFLQALEVSVDKLKQEHDTKLFYSCLHGVYNYQKSMVMMMENNKPLLVNQHFLDFFHVENLEAFSKKYKDIGSLFLEHDNFLYNTSEVDWLDEMSSNEDKVYHVNIKNHEGSSRHFLSKYHLNQKSHKYSILSFDDVTELNLAELFDAEHAHDEKKFDDEKSLFNLLELIQKNEIKVHLYNYYKGLTIVNEATIEEVKDGTVVLKTDYMQQKAIRYEGKTLISSEVLPTTISCDTVLNNCVEKQSVRLKDLHFSRTSPATRKTIRLLPEEKHSVSLFVDNRSKYKSYMSIEDISLDSVKLKFSVPPTELKIGDKVVIDMVLSCENRPFIVNAQATVFKKMNMSVIFLLGLDMNKKNNLLKYIVNRQIDIIKEFKKLKNS